MEKWNERGKGPRRNAPHSSRPPDWSLDIALLGQGEEGDDLRKRFYFGAYKGYHAKMKALPIIRHFLAKIELDHDGSSPKVAVSLKRVLQGGRKDKAPSYVLTARYSYFRSLLAAKKSSEVFKIANGRNGGNGHRK